MRVKDSGKRSHKGFIEKMIKWGEVTEAWTFMTCYRNYEFFMTPWENSRKWGWIRFAMVMNDSKFLVAYSTHCLSTLSVSTETCQSHGKRKKRTGEIMKYVFKLLLESISHQPSKWHSQTSQWGIILLSQGSVITQQ